MGSRAVRLPANGGKARRRERESLVVCLPANEGETWIVSGAPPAGRTEGVRSWGCEPCAFLWRAASGRGASCSGVHALTRS